MSVPDPLDAVLLDARARVLADLTATGLADAAGVSVLEAALEQRSWWVRQWPQGAAFVPGQVAQDVQDALLDAGVRWPVCEVCADPAEHTLALEPELGEDPEWVCAEAGIAVAPLGGLAHRD